MKTFSHIQADIVADFSTFSTRIKKAAMVLFAAFALSTQGYSQNTTSKTTLATLPYMKLNVAGSSCSDETVVRFGSMCTDGFDNNFDIYKQQGDAGCPSLYTTIDAGSEELSINSLNLSFSRKVVPLNMEGPAGTYTLIVKEQRAFDRIDHIELVDKIAGKSINLQTDTSYTFTRTASDAAGRFEIQFSYDEAPSGVSGVKGSSLNKVDFIKVADRKIKIEESYMSSPMQLEVYSMSGEVVMVQDNKQAEIALPESLHGIYIIRASFEGEYAQKKVFLD